MPRSRYTVYDHLGKEIQSVEGDSLGFADAVVSIVKDNETVAMFYLGDKLIVKEAAHATQQAK